MTPGTINNCPHCGKLFLKSVRDICPDCYKEIEAEYQQCYKFMRKKESRSCTIMELSEATRVSISQITRFILEGRLQIMDHPNLSYACKSCGASIRTGVMCENCRKEFSKQLTQLSEDEERKAAQKDGQGASHLYRVEKEL
ncbi:flagellar protein [Aneurinibacillus sp. Ricciae_BoGa-3]|uniref:TIGR03826 family flagellar region protein n=1 Tax=Aneurinibacillus sp. Ricciae_BoGa-3 TaxID=3022697 RepID=UPI0023407070|nr:TIGR03826 family flagellar region protein [Aneurinibacillus sp. Ricciae_BoGa-3]WCK55484.1 flagellar protein [Aneurinibacillus sp. Ricciae_BoGa-3]